MKRTYFALLLCALFLFSACGDMSKSSVAEEKYIEVSELYSSLAPTVAGIGETAVASLFSKWGATLSSYGTQLQDSEALSDAQLDEIIASIDTIEKELSELHLTNDETKLTEE